ncbi:MAG: RNA polymerase subunit sigma-54 [Salinibacter sp.]|uniref:RNA polymerase subunit sigma-54 n=1 Tax=Salinibacter sp. TaxID=2065818 RepID=UPI0035D4FD00
MGFQVGRPGGAVVKVYRPGPLAYDGILTTDADEFVAIRIHRLWESPLPDSPLHLYLGPGALLGAEQLDRSPRVRFGLSAEAGLNFYAERFEVFLHVTPTLRFFPNTEASLDGNVGLRYYVRFR